MKLKRTFCALLALVMTIGVLPGGESRAFDNSGLQQTRESVYAQADVKGNEAEACDCADCQCADCQCADGACLCGECGGIDGCGCSDAGLCADALCTDSGSCGCGEEHAHDAALPAPRERKIVEAPAPIEPERVASVDVITGANGKTLRELIAEREARVAELLAGSERKAASALRSSTDSARLVYGSHIDAAAEDEAVLFDDRDDAVYCEYCDKYIYGDWICDNGPHCSENSSNEDCYSSEHCSECGKCEYTVCEDCYRCEVCWYHCISCGNCFEPNEICESCHTCEACQEAHSHCRDCGACCCDEDGNYSVSYTQCVNEGHFHCCTCADDYRCDDCGNCYYTDTDDFCGMCQKCMGCACVKGPSATHCWYCCDMDACVEAGGICEKCRLCDSCQSFVEFEDGDVGSYHCWECDACGGGEGTSWWCPSLFEENANDMFHCANCCEKCPQCGKCIIAAVVDLCSDCGKCPECCEKNSDEFGCTHDLCIDSSEFDEHVCPSCFACDGGEKCAYCGMCARCCENYHCHSHDWCPEAPGYDEHFCDNCGECADPDEFCDYCGYCLVCQAAETHCAHGICEFGPEAYEHFCDICGECIEEYCEICGGHLEHCEEERESFGCEHDWVCPNSSEWEEHFCSDCGRCYEFSEFCDSCGLCENCCAENTEDYGCDHGVCVSSSEWEDHFCFEHCQCLEYCIEDGLHEEECDHDPDGEYCWDDENHWQHCTECEGRVDVEDHVIAKTTVTSPTYADYGYEQWTCEICGADLGLKRLPKRMLGDHTHSFGGDAACTVCGYIDEALARIKAEPQDVRCTVSDYQEDYSENTASFSVFAKGDDLKYHWFSSMNGVVTELEDGEMIRGAGSNVLTVVVPTDACYCDYEYWCDVWNSHGKVTSRHAKLKAQHEYYWAAAGEVHQFLAPDATYQIWDRHALVCIGEGCDAQKSLSEHSWPLTWTVEYPATTERNGLRSRKCLTCSQKEYRTINRITEEHVHHYTILKNDDNRHWYECTCGRLQYSFVHVYDWDDWYEITPATETATGLEGTDCVVCGFTKTRETDVIPHTHSYYTWEEITDGFAAGTWEHMIEADQYSHSIKCRYYDLCGESRREPHRWADGYTPIGLNADGAMSFYHRCLDCGYEESVSFPSDQWSFIGNGAQVKDVDRFKPLYSSAGGCYIYVDGVKKTGSVPTGIRVVQGEAYLSDPEVITSTNGNYRIRYLLETIPQSVKQSEDFNSRNIIFEAVYSTCPHPRGILSGGFPAGCETYGKQQDKVCVLCGEVLTEGAPIAPLGAHNYVLDTASAITGYCSYVPSSDPTGVVGKGYEGDWVCSVCGDRRQGSKTKSVHNDEWEAQGEIAADCYNNGFSGDTICTACGKTLERGHKTPRLAHEWFFPDGWVIEPTAKRSGQAYAECRLCGEQKLCSMQNMDALRERLGFTEEEWRAKLDYTEEDWEIRVSVSSNQNAPGYLEYDAGDLALIAGSFNWSDRYFDQTKRPTYTFHLSSTGRNKVRRIADLNPGDSFGNIPFDCALGADGMSFTFTAPADTEGAGEYYFYVHPIFEVEKDDGTTANVPLGDLITITRSGDYVGQVENFSAAMSLVPGVRSRSITLQDVRPLGIIPLSREISGIYDRDGGEIRTARAGQKVRVVFDTTTDTIDWADFDHWEFASGEPAGQAFAFVSRIQEFIMPDNDIVMNAYYTSSGYSFKVSFDMGGIGDQVPERSVRSMDMIGSVPEPMDPTGWWKFDGWYREESLIHPVDPASEMVRGNRTLYAKWKRRPAQVDFADISGVILGKTGSFPGAWLYDAAMSDEAIRADLRKAQPEQNLKAYRATVQYTNCVDGIWYHSVDFTYVEVGSYKLGIRKELKGVPVILTIEADAFTDLGDIPTILYGDVNDDGEVNSLDVLQINRYIAGKTSVFDLDDGIPRALREQSANVTAITGSDTDIDSEDVLEINRYIVHAPSVFDSLS